MRRRLGSAASRTLGSEFVVLVARGVYKFDVDEVPVPQGEASDLEPWGCAAINDDTGVYIGLGRCQMPRCVGLIKPFPFTARAKVYWPKLNPCAARDRNHLARHVRGAGAEVHDQFRILVGLPHPG